MRIGISVTSRHGDVDARTGARWMVERAQDAEAAQLDSLSVGDHHVTPQNYFQNTPMTGRLAAEWGPRPLGCLFLVPLWHPVLMAEHIGTLASLAAGPFIVQTGIGYGDDQFEAFGKDTARRGRDIEANLAVVKALLAGQPGPSGSVISPTPPEPVRWWLGSGMAGVDRAARLGDCWYAGPGLSPTSIVPLIDAYRQACARHDTEPHVIARKDVIVLEDGERAERLGKQLLEAGYRGLGRDQVAFGDPASVADQLAPFSDHGVEEIVVRCMAVPQEIARETIQAMGEVRTTLRG